MSDPTGNMIIGILGMLFVAALIGACFAGFHIAGKNCDRKNYILRGIFWSFLVYFGGILALAALAFGACILMLAGMK